VATPKALTPFFPFSCCVLPKEPTLFNLAHAYRKERFFDHAVVCLERCLALKETSSAFSALGYCLHLHAMTMPLSRREEAKVLLHQAIDTYHQALAKKPDAAFCTEMLAKALGDALNETDFFMTSVLDDGGDPQHLQHQQQQQQLKGEVGEMFGSLSSTNLSASRGIGDDWAKDGLSLSVESASDVDMT
jgi:hypothetical protein